MSDPIDLASLTTFGVPSRARHLVALEHPDDIRAWCTEHTFDPDRDLVLAGGSNLLLREDVAGTVLQVALPGRRIVAESGDDVIVEFGAGERWHDAVRWSLDQELNGLENLSLIPGSVGAAPIQNIGAYGAELAPVFESLTAWDFESNDWRTLEREDCRFEYRSSRFKAEDAHRFLIARVRLRLSRVFRPHLDYAGVREELDAMGVTEPNARSVSEAVIRIRRRKLPDPRVLGNAGSFFKNPLVSVLRAEAMKDRWPELPTWPGGADRAKLSAAWMIDQCGWKGHRDGDAGVSEQHALVLVNHGKATGAEIWALARQVAESVRERFGVTLSPEPRIFPPAEV